MKIEVIESKIAYSQRTLICVPCAKFRLQNTLFVKLEPCSRLSIGTLENIVKTNAGNTKVRCYWVEENSFCLTLEIKRYVG